MLNVGDPVPWFTLPSHNNPNYHFDTVAGHHVVLFFFGSGQHPRAAAALQYFLSQHRVWRDRHIPFFGVSIDPTDQGLAPAVADLPYCKLLWDLEREVSRRYGVAHTVGSGTESGDRYQPTVFILNENLRILHRLALEGDAEALVATVMAIVDRLPLPAPPRMAERQAPVLFIPDVFDRDFCQHLIQQYHRSGGTESGFMRDIDGKTVQVMDYEFKRRRDWLIQDPELLETVNTLILRRIKPEIQKAYQYEITRFERHLIACYDDTRQGFFNSHRDNTTKGTAHRRFAMSLNLNTGEYEGGCLRFPEYGTQLYRPEAGEAIIFSCGLLHEATPVTQGERFVLLSFFYGEDGAQIREQNRRYVPMYDESSEPQAPSSQPEASPQTEAPRKAKTGRKQGFQPNRSSRS